MFIKYNTVNESKKDHGKYVFVRGNKMDCYASTF